MQVKKADLHCSYSAPVRVSVAVAGLLVVAARGKTCFCDKDVVRADVRVAIFVVWFFEGNMETFFALRADTTGLIGLRDVTERTTFVL